MDYNDNPECGNTDVPATDSTYRGAGAGKKESPYADSPYETSFTEPEQPPRQTEAPQSWAEQQQASEAPQKPRKPKKEHAPGMGRRIGTGIVALALVAGSCGLTAWGMNSHWQQKTDDLQQQFESQISDLQKQIGGGVSGTSVSAGGLMTPSQVYAQNVGAVVAISNQAHTQSWTGETMATVSTGSGFVISPDGYIISNCHVVKGAEQLTVTTHMGQEYVAELIGYDELNDISLLKVDAQDLQAVTIGSSDELIVGDMVVAIGNPLGDLTATQTVGYISGKDRSVSTDGSIINMLQTDAAINPGNSGGPMFNMRGEVIGITTAKYSGNTPSGASIEGIGFAIPIDDVMGMIDDFKNYGYLKNQAYLGVKVLNMDPTTASMYSLPTGSYVQSVNEGSSAEKAGVLPKDIIIAIGDMEVDSNAKLTMALRRFSAGDTTTITVFRAGDRLELPITFDEKPQVTEDQPQPPAPGEMPADGSYDEWYNYFAPFFGNPQN